jgi:hypothetical protein
MQLQGRAIAQAVSRRLLTVAALVRVHFSPVDSVALGQVPSSSGLSCKYHSTATSFIWRTDNEPARGRSSIEM